jgi:hypothetical protein
MTVSEIANIFLDRSPTEEEFSQFCESSNLEMRDALDAISIDVGRRFLSGALTYEQGDEIMNMVWGYALKRDTIPKTMYAIYEAFDRGEYLGPKDRKETDPVMRYTRPALQRLLER